MKHQLDGMYPFERADNLYKEIKKLGVFEDGKNFLDKFRVLITNVGNALGYLWLLMLQLYPIIEISQFKLLFKEYRVPSSWV